jgi:hypothetical protein
LENEQGSRFFIQQEIKISQFLRLARNEREPDFCVAPGVAEVIMPKDKMKHDKMKQGIVLDEKAQEQPQDKKRAQSSAQTENKDDELQPLREKSGF